MKALHALIIDDDAKNVDILARLLAVEGITSTQVTDPAQLETTIETLSQIDLVFLDLEMPFFDGYEVLSWLKSRPGFAGVPIVACTVHVSEISVAHQQGFDGFLGKPLSLDRFPGQLRRILSGKQVWEAV